MRGVKYEVKVFAKPESYVPLCITVILGQGTRLQWTQLNSTAGSIDTHSAQKIIIHVLDPHAQITRTIQANKYINP